MIDKITPRSELIQIVKALNDLILSPGWQQLNVVIKGQLEARVQNVMLVPTGSGDTHPVSSILQAEYAKGEYNGLVSAMQLPQVQIDMIEAVLATQNEEPEDGYGNSNTSSP